MKTMTDKTAEQVIAEALEAAAISPSYASDILQALTAAGFELMAPQDLEWGSCPETPGEPHQVSLSLCSGCLQYDPE